MNSSNITVLTQSHAVLAKKRKARKDKIQEIIFDDEARREFLTGFHKRKQQRMEEKKAKRKEREKQERLEERRQNRQMLAERAANNAAQVEAAYGGKPVDETDTQGPDSEEDTIQEEYENEEQVATVTVVEDFDIDALIHAESPSKHPNPGLPNQSGLSEHRAKEPKSTITNKTSGTSKKKATSAKKIRYETKATRLAEKKKQLARKLEKATRAGGKQSRYLKKRK
ncbi:hypothetical protein BDM02DRAFT_3092304 [Thelephora ganbajun]|uniref:Uncharacterized protein n=1 Tax=Thelephora ganbajun TaxID=370292 RepID=A0ACB6ZN85_THEGA|nr:hypothetical protein BDM02DRAFT_3092304 [Thelephora ganbajun]